MGLFCHLAVISCIWLIPFTLNLAAAKESHLHTKQQEKSFYFPKYRPEIFYDNKVLPEDVEVDVFVIKDRPQRLFYILEGGYRPLSITVTPCSLSPLEWTLSHQPMPSATSVSMFYRSESRFHKTARSRPIISPSATYTGSERRSYTNPQAPPGLYTLELDATSTMKVQVVVTTRPCTEYTYHPPLPALHTVQIVKVKRNRVLISWKPSAFKRPLGYCVSLNTAANYNSLCSANSDANIAHNQATPPTGAGFGFQWEKAAKREILTNFISDVPRNNVSLFCIGSKTWHMFKGLARNTTYYFDVFAVDTGNNASTAYVGAKALVKNVPKLPWLKEDAFVQLSLNAHNGYASNVKYFVGKGKGALYVFIQSCTGPGPITFTVSQHVFGEKPEVVLSENVIDMKTLLISQDKKVQNLTYALNVHSPMNIARQIRVWISSKKQSFPFPMLSSDKSLRVFETLTTCDSITLGWKASQDEKVKYCIYKTAALNSIIQETLAQPQNYCENPKNDSSKILVLCRRYHRFSKRRFNNVIMQKIKGLTPKTSYLFEVEVTKVKGKMLPYEQVWASTSRSCGNQQNEHQT